MDAAWASDPDVVVAVSVRARQPRAMPQLDWKLTSLLSRVGRIVPNPATAKISFEVLVRAAEIALGRSAALANAMAPPEHLVEVDVEDIGFRDFHRLAEAVERGREAATRSLPGIRALLSSAPRATESAPSSGVDPVCEMSIGPRRARAQAVHAGQTYVFCSENCRDAFLRAPESYVRSRSQVLCVPRPSRIASDG